MSVTHLSTGYRLREYRCMPWIGGAGQRPDEWVAVFENEQGDRLALKREQIELDTSAVYEVHLVRVGTR